MKVIVAKKMSLLSSFSFFVSSFWRTQVTLVFGGKFNFRAKWAFHKPILFPISAMVYPYAGGASLRGRGCLVLSIQSLLRGYSLEQSFLVWQ